MNTIKTLLLLVTMVMLHACASTATFPISKIVPAADITAKKKMDRNNNIKLEITARNLASPKRLTPAGNNYSVWIVTEEYGIKNVGQLRIENAEKSTLETVTPFNFDELFITVENQGDLKFPSGSEISRTKF